mmetsp:Transcript_11454/g.25142  ORF Transcript_11454/g.25142 Transcript_11454/m.25142 type:complete len:373 (+) Transcript_11454:297-1415(+)
MSLKPALLKFKFEDFESLPTEPNTCVWSETLPDCHGNAWQLQLKPNGNMNRDDSENWVGLFLKNMATSSILVDFSFILRDALGKKYHERTIDMCKLKAQRNKGTSKFIKRSKVLDGENKILFDGALHVDVHLKFKLDSLHKQPSSLASNMLELLEKGEGADASFKIGDKIFPVHKVILRTNASDLFNFCGDNDDGCPISINDINPNIFLIILRYVYGEEVPDTSTIMASTNSKDIIAAANRFGVIGLKLAAETALVESSVVTTENVADWLIFADSKTCPLLKEQAIAFIVSRSEDVLNSESSKHLKESPKLLTELVLEISKSANIATPFDVGRNVSVNDLRGQLHDEGLDVDGSKEMLIARLQTSNKRQRTE